MTTTPGISFSPIQDDPTQHGPTANRPIQEAIRTLSLRIPQTRPGANAIAPNALMSAPGAAGLAPASGGANLGGLEQILRKLFGLPATGSFAPSLMAAGPAPAGAGGGGGNIALMPSGSGSAPLPNITPGVVTPPNLTPVSDPGAGPWTDPQAAPFDPFVGGGSPLGTALGDKYGV